MTKPTISVEEAKRRRAQQRQAKQRPEPNGHGDFKPPPPRFKILALSSLDELPQDDWLVQGLLPPTGVAVVYGRWKSFKSFVALDLAWTLADPMRPTWAGRPINRHGAIIYLVCEGQSGMRKRIMAYKVRQGADELPAFYWIEQRINLGAPRSKDTADLIASIKEALPGQEIALVVVDTLVRTLFGADENNEGMRNFLDNAEDIAEGLGCLVLAVHHEGATADSGRPRGGTTLPAGVVASWHIKRTRGEGLHCKLLVEEAKDSVSDFAFDVDLQKFEFGDEHDERRESTLIVTKIAAVEGQEGETEDQPRPRKRRHSPNDSLFFSCMDQSLDRHGIELYLSDGRPRVKAVNSEYVRTLFARRRPDIKDTDSVRRMFDRFLDKHLGGQALLAEKESGLVYLFYPTKQ
jgi:hypothetical protein